ncbi:MAG: hypothetical protein U0587_03355 [Candidatus Binatia bacterium]
MTVRQSIRFPLLAVAMLALLAGMWAGLLRLGWYLPLTRPDFLLTHGPLMVCGFLGTLIGIERAVALVRPWTYLGPLFTALGALALIAGVAGSVAALAMTAGSVWLLLMFGIIIRAQPALFTITMGVGALAWFVGNVLWLSGWPVYEVATWWMGFLVLTIAGERLELSRFAQRSRASETVFLIIVVALWVGFASGGMATIAGARVIGVALLALTAWLLRHDIARRTVRQSGLTRYVAVCLLSGYVWLGFGGIVALLAGRVVAGLPYDAILHAIFVGFVFAMIFGHAPIILPAVAGVPVPFRPAFYSHLALLHLSLLLRVGGDLVAALTYRQWGGLLNVVAILLFMANTAAAVVHGRRATRRSAAVRPREQVTAPAQRSTV